jgi:hypothetical protein
MMINYGKETNSKIPFWGVYRMGNGTVICCSRNVEIPCDNCIFIKCCMVSEVKNEPSANL